MAEITTDVRVNINYNTSNPVTVTEGGKYPGVLTEYEDGAKYLAVFHGTLLSDWEARYPFNHSRKTDY